MLHFVSLAVRAEHRPQGKDHSLDGVKRNPGISFPGFSPGHVLVVRIAVAAGRKRDEREVPHPKPERAVFHVD